MPALRLMTFNVQMLPLLATIGEGVSDDAEVRAERVADAILSIPVNERPHVIAFNEVFNEDGRAVLKKRLAAWSHIIEKIDNGSVDEDAGLMLLSQLPFRPLSTGGTFFEHFYTQAEDTDKLACKAVAIVRVNQPDEFTFIAFTHLQASYLSEDQYDDVRISQLQEIHDALKAVVGPDPNEWRNVILVGDLNIRGDSGAESGEWTSTFITPGREFQAAMRDGWRTWMHRPGTLTDPDPGFTNIDLATGKRQRLDYQCFSLLGVPATGALPHHMFIRLRDQSDHFSLEAVIERWSPHCTPSEAFELDTIGPIGAASGTPTTLTQVDVKFESTDAFQWIFVPKPGTYTVYTTSNLVHRLFLETDLSHAISPVDTLSVTELPPEAQAGFGRTKVDPKGTTFSARLPFFIAVQTTAVDPHPGTVFVFEHLGDTPATAIWLHPHQTTPTSFPENQPLGVDDTCWFKAEFSATFAGGKRTETFTFSNPTGTFIEITLLDTAQVALDAQSGTQAEFTCNVEVAGGEKRLFSLRRSSIKEVGYTCFWFSPLTYLALDQPLGLYISDESGPDALGDDEIDLEIAADGAKLFSDSWDSADTGERWPGLAEAIRNRVAAVLPGQRRAPFTEDISLSYIEEDISAGTYLVEMLQPLAATDPDDVPRRLTLPVPDDISDGRYTFYCTLCRFPE
jgi:hypothetical protein